jgi:hypothetical protein
MEIIIIFLLEYRYKLYIYMKYIYIKLISLFLHYKFDFFNFIIFSLIFSWKNFYKINSDINSIILILNLYLAIK